MRTRVLVIGAGIGGCATALALARHGVEVLVVESVREMAPLGVGINVLPHAMGVLAELGQAERVEALGVATAELAFFNRHGQLIWREPRGRDAGYPVPQVSVHRGRLQMALHDAVLRALGRPGVLTGHEAVAVDTGDDRSLARVELRRRDAGETAVIEADLVIAADGIHSAIRRQFVPDEGPPRWSGNLLWRATTVAPGFLTGRSMVMIGHRPHKFVAYPITMPDADGRQVINWIAELDRREHGLAGREDWNRVVDRSVFAEAFADWRFDWLDVPGLIAGAEAVYEFPMVDRDPLPAWTRGRVTLLGDAAHPMYPIGSNGASQAILDAACLTRCVGEHGIHPDALSAYEMERRPATAAIVESNRRHGPERVLDLAEERAPDGFGDVSEVFAPGELEAISAQYKQIAGFSPPGGQTTR